MKILFLDIDGVLNSSDFFDRTVGAGGLIARVEGPETMLDPAAVELLNEVVERTDCKVVISSAWRIGYPHPKTFEHLKVAGFTGEVIGETPYRGDTDRLRRGREIRDWMVANGRERYVNTAIVDDDHSMLPGQPLVLTTFKHGLLREHVEALVALLGET